MNIYIRLSTSNIRPATNHFKAYAHPERQIKKDNSIEVGIKPDCGANTHTFGMMIIHMARQP